MIHDYLRFDFFINIVLTRIYTNARFLGVFRKGLLNMKKHYKNRGFGAVRGTVSGA